MERSYVIPSHSARGPRVAKGERPVRPAAHNGLSAVAPKSGSLARVAARASVKAAAFWALFLFQWPGAANAGDLSRLSVYPNPARVYLGDSEMVFDNVAGGEVEIYDVHATIVREMAVGQDPFITWDLKNDDGDLVGSGIYLYVVTSGSEKKTGKLAVIR